MNKIENGTLGMDRSLETTSVDELIPTQKQVRIKVIAAGVNRPDLFQRMGLYPPPPGVTDVLGLEVSGIIDAIGDNVTEFSVGDKVCALVQGGGYADTCLSSVDTCLPIPEGLSYEEAAGLPETFFTVWSNVFNRGHLAEGEVILIHGGSSGIGTAAIQLAKAFNAKVITTVGNSQKVAYCLNLGADCVINYREMDFAEHIQSSRFKGVDIVLDMVAGDYTQKHLDLLNPGGRLVLIAFLKGPKTDLNLVPVLTKNLIITGSTLRPKSDAYKKAIRDDLLKYVWPLLESGQIKSIVDRVFPLKDFEEAHAYMQASQHMGKIILKP